MNGSRPFLTLGGIGTLTLASLFLAPASGSAQQRPNAANNGPTILPSICSGYLGCNGAMGGQFGGFGGQFGGFGGQFGGFSGLNGQFGGFGGFNGIGGFNGQFGGFNGQFGGFNGQFG